MNVNSTTSVEIRSLSPAELAADLVALVTLLKNAVDGGAGLGFVPPLSDSEGRAYWLSICPELQAGSRLLLGAYAGGRIVGTGQLMLARWSSSQHRAEVQKLLVDSAHRGQGVGKLLIIALHDAARQLNRSLIVLNTRRGQPTVRFYKQLGYREAGVIPGFSRNVTTGERRDTMILYQELAL